jgi:hypothetical protein
VANRRLSDGESLPVTSCKASAHALACSSAQDLAMHLLGSCTSNAAVHGAVRFHSRTVPRASLERASSNAFTIGATWRQAETVCARGTAIHKTPLGCSRTTVIQA